MRFAIHAPDESPALVELIRRSEVQLVGWSKTTQERGVMRAWCDRRDPDDLVCVMRANKIYSARDATAGFKAYDCEVLLPARRFGEVSIIGRAADVAEYLSETRSRPLTVCRDELQLVTRRWRPWSTSTPILLRPSAWDLGTCYLAVVGCFYAFSIAMS